MLFGKTKNILLCFLHCPVFIPYISSIYCKIIINMFDILSLPIMNNLAVVP